MNPSATDPDPRQVLATCRDTLFQDVVPFWLRHGLDRVNGGMITSLDRDGTVIDTDKAVWFQGRAAWMFATLYNTVEQRPEWLEAARSCLEFLGRYCIAPSGKMYFAVTREGKPLRMRRYVYSESFAAIAAALAFIGIAANFATSKLFSLLTLSDLYAAATTAAQKAQFLAAGQATLALGALGGIGGSVEGGVPMAAAGLIFSVVMLRSNILGRGVGYAGLLANGTGLLMYVYAAAAPTPAGSPFFGAFFLLSVLWFIVMGVRLLRFGRNYA